MTRIHEQVLEAVADGCSMAFEIQERTNLKRSTITQAMIELTKEGKLVRKYRGVYALAEGVKIPKKEKSVFTFSDLLKAKWFR